MLVITDSQLKRMGEASFLDRLRRVLEESFPDRVRTIPGAKVDDEMLRQASRADVYGLSVGALAWIEVIRAAFQDDYECAPWDRCGCTADERHTKSGGYDDRGDRCVRFAPHTRVIFPRTTGRAAPVALGTLPGRPFHVSHASSANATASLACEGMPNSSTVRNSV